MRIYRTESNESIYDIAREHGERTAMRRFKIADLRLIFENDIRFLEQF